jgi:hypothetical protein
LTKNTASGVTSAKSCKLQKSSELHFRTCSLGLDFFGRKVAPKNSVEIDFMFEENAEKKQLLALHSAEAKFIDKTFGLTSGTCFEAGRRTRLETQLLLFFGIQWSPVICRLNIFTFYSVVMNSS